MPKLKPVKRLSDLSLSFCVKNLHLSAKLTAKLLRVSNNAEENKKPFILTRKDVENFAQLIPVSLLQDLWQEFELLVISDQRMLDENYYNLIGGLLTTAIRILRLDKPNFFQDSSLAIESFLGQNLFECSKLVELRLTKRVSDLIDFNFNNFLRKFPTSFPELRILVLQGLKQIEIQPDDMEDFLHSVSKKCSHIQHLDLSESNLSSTCFEILSSMSSLKVVILSHSSGLSTVGIVLLLQKLKHLIRCEAHRGTQSSLQNAIASNDNDSIQSNSFQAKLHHFTFRTPSQESIEQVSRTFPSIEQVRILFNVFELGISARLDDPLNKLIKFEAFKKGKLTTELELTGFNMLFMIQVSNLKNYGPCLTRITLTECEFVHPQTLNPVAMFCPNLVHLSLENPSTVPDDLFVGQVPPLSETPFQSLKILTYEGEHLPHHVAKFLLSHTTGLQQLQMSLDTLSLQIIPVFQLLFGVPRHNLESATFCFGHLDLFPAEISEEEKFSNLLIRFLESANMLQNLTVYVMQNGDQELELEMEHISTLIQQNNLDLQFKYKIKYRKLRN